VRVRSFVYARTRREASSNSPDSGSCNLRPCGDGAQLCHRPLGRSDAASCDAERGFAAGHVGGTASPHGPFTGATRRGISSTATLVQLRGLRMHLQVSDADGCHVRVSRALSDPSPVFACRASILKSLRRLFLACLSPSGASSRRVSGSRGDAW